MKKWFKDVPGEVQLLPVNLRRKSDNNLTGEEILDDQSYFFLSWHGKNEDGYSYQVVFNTCQTLNNNHYQIYLFDDDNTYIHLLIKQSKTLLPPVWDRLFGGVDYYDYINIMEELNNTMIMNNLKPFEIDYSKENKFIYMIKETYEEAMELIKQGKSYNILSMKATVLDEGKLELKNISKVE